jgi:hypothetical protein
LIIPAKFSSVKIAPLRGGSENQHLVGSGAMACTTLSTSSLAADSGRKTLVLN